MRIDSNFSIRPAAIPSPWRPSVLKLSAGFWLRLFRSDGFNLWPLSLFVALIVTIVVCSFCNYGACLFLSEWGRRLSYRLLRNVSDQLGSLLHYCLYCAYKSRAVNFCWIACVRWLHSTVLLVISCNYASLQRGCISQLLTLLSGVIDALCTQTRTKHADSISLIKASLFPFIHSHTCTSAFQVQLWICFSLSDTLVCIWSEMIMENIYKC